MNNVFTYLEPRQRQSWANIFSHGTIIVHISVRTGRAEHESAAFGLLGNIVVVEFLPKRDAAE
jgi:hypothetical protein